MSALRRITKTVPGYDCVRHPCGKNQCGALDGAGHGIHCDEWIYVVTDGEIALALVVFSGVYPASVPRKVAMEVTGSIRPRGRTKVAQGVDLALHTSFPRDREAVRAGRASREPCEFLRRGTLCYFSAGSVLAADAFFQAHGTDQYTQPESFWGAFETEWKEWAEAARAERVDEAWTQCPHCAGEGVVPRG